MHETPSLTSFHIESLPAAYQPESQQETHKSTSKNTAKMKKEKRKKKAMWRNRYSPKKLQHLEILAAVRAVLIKAKGIRSTSICSFASSTKMPWSCLHITGFSMGFAMNWSRDMRFCWMWDWDRIQNRSLRCTIIWGGMRRSEVSVGIWV